MATSSLKSSTRRASLGTGGGGDDSSSTSTSSSNCTTSYARRTTNKAQCTTINAQRTTDNAYGTTNNAYSTINKAARDTTNNAHGTTDNAQGTTKNAARDTTNNAYGTTNNAVRDTTNNAYGTTNNAYGTTNKPARDTTNKAHDTTNNAYGTTNNAYGTVNNALGTTERGDGTRGKVHRRARSLSRVSPRFPGAEEEYSTPKGKFVNMKRGSEFPDVSLDDLALEFFSSSQEKSGDEVREREGRSVGRFASDTASSRRRGRSVSRQRGVGSGGEKSSVSNDSRGKVAGANSTRRRSLSVVRYQASDSESDADLSQRFGHKGKIKSLSDKSQTTTSMAQAAPNARTLGRSPSQKDLSLLRHGYSRHSSALTDDDTRGSHMSKFGTEKTIRAVYAQKKIEHPTDEEGSGLYEAMRKELRYAVEEIRNELQQSEKSKQDSPAKIKLEDQQARDLSKIIKEMVSSSKISTASQKPAWTKKRSNDRNNLSKQLGEEADKYFEDFASNVEDTDISSFDEERSETSSTIGGTISEIDGTTTVEALSHQSPAGSISHPTGTDGVILPWLQWETSNDSSLPGKSIRQPLGTPKAIEWNVEPDMVTLMYDPNSNSKSSIGSSSPGLFDVYLKSRKADSSKSNLEESGGCKRSQFDTEEYRHFQMKEELLFERFKERQRIDSGGLLLCAGSFYRLGC